MSTMQEKLDNVTCRRTATLEIVSSGYEDRYVQQNVNFVITKNNIDFSVDAYSTYNRCVALLTIAGVKITKKSMDLVIDKINKSTFTESIYFEDGRRSGWINTTSEKISAGIHVNNNYCNLSEYGKNKYSEIAKTLTNEEWLAVKTGLHHVNLFHTDKGLQIVPITI